MRAWGRECRRCARRRKSAGRRLAHAQHPPQHLHPHYSQEERYTEIANEMKHMLTKVGWKPDFIEKNVPILPISGWMGDNLLKKSEKMGWWKGCDIMVGKESLHVDTLYDVLDKMVRMPERKTDAPLRLPISGAYKIKGVGDVLAGRVEQGVVKPGEEVIFLPTHTASNPCTGKVFTVEMHHQRAARDWPRSLEREVSHSQVDERCAARVRRVRRRPRVRRQPTHIVSARDRTVRGASEARVHVDAARRAGLEAA